MLERTLTSAVSPAEQTVGRRGKRIFNPVSDKKAAAMDAKLQAQLSGGTTGSKTKESVKEKFQRKGLGKWRAKEATSEEA